MARQTWGRPKDYVVPAKASLYDCGGTLQEEKRARAAGGHKAT